MLFPRPVVHGVYVLCYLSRQPSGKVVPAREVAGKMDVPPEQASKILQALAGAGLVRGQRGRQGGYTLDKSLQEITLADVFTAIYESNGEDRLYARQCPEARPEMCTAHEGLMRLHARFWEALKAESLASLIGRPCNEHGVPHLERWFPSPTAIPHT